MSKSKQGKDSSKPVRPRLNQLLGPYRPLIGLLLLLAFISNALNLSLPRLMQHAIDAYARRQVPLDFESLLALSTPFLLVSLVIWLIAYLQSLVQNYASEKVAFDLRQQLASRISEQNFPDIQAHSPAKLLTHLTSDIDAIKLYISMAIPSLASSFVLILGASTLLLTTHWQLALAVLSTLPMLVWLFFGTFKRVRPLFKRAQEAIDQLNRVISESILGSALIRVLTTQSLENKKFESASETARQNGLMILAQFAGLIPWVTFIASFGSLILLVLGGHFLIQHNLTLGQFTAFNSYLGLLIFPILIISFMSNIMARATASYARIVDILNAKIVVSGPQIEAALEGEMEVKDLSLELNQKPILKNLHFKLPAGSRTAIIGPTAAGKTSLLYLLSGLLDPTQGQVLIDGSRLSDYAKSSLHRQLGIVFQDSSLFNISLRENIAFNQIVTETDLQKAIETAELAAFIETLPNGLETQVSERGLSLSGGQKQRLMLARALALNPRILLLDDFTARVDAVTEQRILDNIARNYPQLTLVSVTQKMAAVEAYEQILLLIEGELLAQGRHEELLHQSPEYVQIYQSQRSTQVYELRSE